LQVNLVLSDADGASPTGWFATMRALAVEVIMPAIDASDVVPTTAHHD